jgi:hypothetical protein
VNPDDMEATQQADASHPPDAPRPDPAGEQFIDSLDDVEADLRAVRPHEQQAVLDRILAETGYRRDGESKPRWVRPAGLDLTTVGAPSLVTADAFGSRADQETDHQLLQALAQAQARVLQDVSGQIEQVRADLAAKMDELGRTQQAVQRARDRAAAIWYQADADQRQAAEAIAWARERADAYQNAAIAKAKEIIARARIEAEAIRSVAGRFADDLLARAAIKALPEPAGDLADDRERGGFHAVAHRHEQLLAAADGASREPTIMHEQLLAGGMAALHERTPAPDPSDQLLSEVQGLGPYLRSKVVLIIAVDGDTDSLRLISPNHGATSREQAWLGWSGWARGLTPTASTQGRTGGPDLLKHHEAVAGGPQDRFGHEGPGGHAGTPRRVRDQARWQNGCLERGVSDVLQLVSVAFCLALLLVALLLAVRTSVPVSAVLTFGIATLLPRTLELSSRLACRPGHRNGPARSAPPADPLR